MRHRTVRPETARVRMLAAQERLRRLLQDPRFGGPELPDETLELVTGCMEAISEVVARRRHCDGNPSTIPSQPGKTHPRH